jgi:type IV pilus secretin PilQ/predicted competence protein
MKVRRNKLAKLLLVLPLWAPPPQGDLVTINARDEELSTLLEGLAIQHRINLVAGDKVQGRVTINLYDVELEVALTQILAAQGLAFYREGTFYRVVTAEELTLLQHAQDVVEARVFILNHLLEPEALELLTPFLTGQGQCAIAGGGQSSGVAAAGGSGAEASSSGRQRAIIVRDVRSNLERIAATLAELDRPPQQVLLEATILTVSLGDENVLGIDFNVLGGIDFDSGGASTDFSGMSPISVAGGALEDLLFSGSTNGFASDSPTSGLSLGLVKNQVAVFLEALEETTNATILSNPKVVALNGQEARIIVGGRLGYTTVVSTQTTSLEEVQFLDTGTQLRFRPHVGADNWIRMDVHPQNSTGIIDPVSGIPSETTAEITTSVLMRDGQTLVIGGLISESVQTTHSQVPLLGSIPILGVLFRRSRESVVRSELVILLTPHILDPIQEERRATEVSERWEAVRRSHLDNLSPHLRPQLARTLHADAEVLRSRGDLDGALGAVERALRLNPTSVPAALLRQELLRNLALEQLPLSEEQMCLEALQGLDAPAATGARRDQEVPR